MDETEQLRQRLKRATDLLRDWRDKYGGRDVIAHKMLGDRIVSASQGDLVRDTQRFLEGK